MAVVSIQNVNRSQATSVNRVLGTGNVIAIVVSMANAKSLTNAIVTIQKQQQRHGKSVIMNGNVIAAAVRMACAKSRTNVRQLRRTHAIHLIVGTTNAVLMGTVNIAMPLHRQVKLFLFSYFVFSQ